MAKKTLEEYRAAQRKKSAYMAQYMRQYRQKHPEKVAEWRIRQALRLAAANGYTLAQNGSDADRVEVS